MLLQVKDGQVVAIYQGTEPFNDSWYYMDFDPNDTHIFFERGYRLEAVLSQGEVVEVKKIKIDQPPHELTPEEDIVLLKQSQEAQDFLLDGIILDIIPSLEEQIGEMSSLTRTLNRTIQVKGGEEMAAYFAKKIMNGRSYESIFKTNVYKQYQDETDTILILEGYSHLIER